MATVCPPMVSAPVRPSELVLAVIVQFTEFPTTVTDAHATFELAVGALHPVDAEAVIEPEPPAPATFSEFALKLYGQIPVCSLKTKPSELPPKTR
jgi:hypothetical protein